MNTEMNRIFCKWRSVLGLLFIIVNGFSALAQTRYTHYMYNNLNVNPAYAGSRGFLEAVLINKTQWVGINGAPLNQHLSINTPLIYNTGIGFTLDRESLGPIVNTRFDTSFSYGVRLSKKVNVAVGLNMGASLFNLDLNSLKRIDEIDVTIQSTDLNNAIYPSLGFGIYFQRQRYYLGVSSPDILKNGNVYFGNDNVLDLASPEDIPVFVTGGYIFTLYRGYDKKRELVKLNPNALVSFLPRDNFVLDLSFNVLFRDQRVAVTPGFRYIYSDFRHSFAVTGMFGVQVNRSFFTGISYDRILDGIEDQVSSPGTFELLVRYRSSARYRRYGVPPSRGF